MEKTKDNIKITYFFGAGASYHSVPIWNMQAKSMKWVAERIESLINDFKYTEDIKEDYKIQLTKINPSNIFYWRDLLFLILYISLISFKITVFNGFGYG